MKTTKFALFLPVLAIATGCAAEATDDDIAQSDESEITSDGNTSTYTSLGDQNCLRKFDEESFTQDSYCGGIGGYSLHIFDGDERQVVSVMNGKKETDLRNVELVDYAFNYIGTKVEWRSTKKDPKSPFALILRQFSSGDAAAVGQDKEMLIVSKVDKGSACIFKVIDAKKHKDANQRARDASNAALKGTCPKTLPKAE